MIDVQAFGAFEGQKIYRAKMISSNGVVLNILNYGALIQSWKVPVNGILRSVVLGFDSFDPYPAHSPYFGAIVGRVANRIDSGSFEFDGHKYDLDLNDGSHHIHGGIQGLSNQIWDMDVDSKSNKLHLNHVSKNGAMGYPGRVEFSVSYHLRGNRIRIEFSARPDQKTPISLAQHNYFNLGGTNHVLDHSLLIAADQFTPCDEHLIPTGGILSVKDRTCDFRTKKTMRSSEGQGMEFDMNFVLPKDRNVRHPVAQAFSPNDDICLKLFTDRPGLQLFNGANMSVKPIGHNGVNYGAFAGFCLEDQMLPDALHHSNFPSIICDPEHPYSHWCEIEIR